MRIPQGATHYLAGDFYHERGDGQHLIRLPGGEWGKAMISDSTEARLWPLNDDLTWLALRCDNWPSSSNCRSITKSASSDGFTITLPYEKHSYTINQWLTRRRELGLEAELPVTPEEDEMWDEKRMDTIGSNGNDGLHYDNVNHPEHYTQGGIECIDAIEAALTPEEFRGYCKGNALKYIWRERMKGGDESIAKAEWYLDKV